EEDWEDYKPGGYHPVNIGDTFSHIRYRVVRKLGWSHISTVWLTRDIRMKRYVALAVVKSAATYTKIVLNELKLFQRLSSPTGTRQNHPGRIHVIAFLDHFRHTGPNGTHVCMVFEVHGESLEGIIERYRNKGVPIPLVKQIAKQVLLGLDYMHRHCGLIHTDIKPESIFLSIDNVESVIQSELAAAEVAGSASSQSSPRPKPIGVPLSQDRPPSPNSEPGPGLLSSAISPKEASQDSAARPASLISIHPMVIPVPQVRMDMNSLERITVKIANLANATLAEDHYHKIQTRQYCSPEVIVGATWGTSVDVWSAACFIIFELVTCDLLFDPAARPHYTKDDDLLAQIMELMGDVPEFISVEGEYSADFFDQTGKLQHINTLNYWPLNQVLQEKYNFSKVDADEMASFLMPILHMHPDKRAQAHELVHHAWLKDVVV
ncbi:kinase-like domain-containing protein, partial [Mycena amicta]